LTFKLLKNLHGLTVLKRTVFVRDLALQEEVADLRVVALQAAALVVGPLAVIIIP
jgi:hypothetical protein